MSEAKCREKSISNPQSLSATQPFGDSVGFPQLAIPVDTAEDETMSGSGRVMRNAQDKHSAPAQATANLPAQILKTDLHGERTHPECEIARS